MTAFLAGLVAGIGTGLVIGASIRCQARRQLHSLAKDLQEESNYMLGDAKASLGKAFGQGQGVLAG